MEIERKFLLRAVPGTKINKVSQQYQGYFSTDPEVRFRSKQIVDPISLRPIRNELYYATIKSVGIKVRDEVEGEITKEFFEHMKEKIGKPFISKLSYSLDFKGTEITASIVDRGQSTSFIYSEVEFESEDTMNKFIWPWPNLLIKEVSDDPDYYMQNYWKRTRGD